MSTKRLLANTYFHSIPPIIRNSIPWAQNSKTQSKPPFLPKGPSVLATNLIKSYFERGLIKEARILFDEMPERDVVAWTAMVAGYTACNHYSHAWAVFCEMVRNGMEPNAFTFSSALKACKGMKALACGALVHGFAIKRGVEGSMYVDNALLDMYATCCASMDEACMVFQHIRAKNAVSWTTLITGYTHRGDGYGGLRVFRQMLHVHGGIFRRGLDSNLALANALIDMYAKCGSITDSCKVFSQMTCRDLVSWTTMMIGYGAHGYGREAVDLYDAMIGSGIRPDRIVFMAVLSACSHAGLVDEGLRCFKSMMGDYRITPNQEIYGCVVDLLGRAGQVEEAYQLIESMPFKPDESVWGPLLGACKAHKLSNLGNLAARKVLNLRPNMVGTYVMLSNIYAAEGKWGEFADIRKLMRGMRSKKEAGRSWIEVKDQVYSFVVGDKMGSHIKWVYRVLDLLICHMRESGYEPDLDSLIHDLEDGT